MIHLFTKASGEPGPGQDGDIWEVRVDGDRVIYRILFAQEGRGGQILLALDAFNKKTQKTPRATIDLAKRRLADWRRRGEKKRDSLPQPPLSNSRFG